MTRAVHILAVALLSAASLNATAGLCFCHRGPDAPVPVPGSHSCCRGPESDGSPSIGNVPSCCHIEMAQRDMTPVAAIQLAPPSVAAVPVVSTAGEPVVTLSSAPAFAPSPPIRVLRL